MWPCLKLAMLRVRMSGVFPPTITLPLLAIQTKFCCQNISKTPEFFFQNIPFRFSKLFHTISEGNLSYTKIHMCLRMSG